MTTRSTVSVWTAAILLAGTGAPGQEVTPLQRREAREQYSEGEQRMRAEDFEGAVVRFRAATRLDPRYVLAHYSLGQASMALKRYPDALQAYQDCKEAIRSEGALEERARAEADRERRDEIRELQDSLRRLRAGKIKSASPGTDVAIEQRIRLLEQANLRGAEQRVRIPAELSLSLGSAHFRLGQLDPAEAEYRAAVDGDDGLGAAHNNLAVIHMLKGRFDEARNAIERAEQAGFAVSDQFKKDLEARAAAGPR